MLARVRVLSVGSLYPPHHLGGYELVWHSTVEAIRAADHEVRVLASDARFGVAEDDEPEIRRVLRWYWRDHEFPPMSLRERLDLERYNAHVFDAELDAFRPDVVNWWAMGGMSLSLIERARRHRLPAVGVVGDDWMDYGLRADGWLRATRRLPRLLKAAIERRTGIPTEVDLEHAALWLFNSSRTLEHARAGGLRLDGARVVHPGVDARVFVPAPETHEWGWNLLCAGRIDPRKGIDTAIAALAELPAEASLTVLGGGDREHLGALRGHALDAGLSDRVRFEEGSRAQVAGALRAADALLFTARWQEPWGLVPLEAMASGTPVVASATGGTREYLRDGENCVVYAPADDPPALADAVRRLATDAELRALLRRGGLGTAARFTAAAHDAEILGALEHTAGIR